MKQGNVVLFLLAIMISCSNELDINAEWKEVPVIYGMLNPDSSRQYIKLYRAFLDESANALDMAKNPDSIYYNDDIELTIEKKNTGQRIILTKIDAASLGWPMEEGIFPSTPNIVYVFNESLDAAETYIIRFFNPATGNVAKAETPVVNDFQINSPLPGSDLNFTSINPITIQWRSAKHGKVYDVVLRFTYEEWKIDQPTSVVTKSIEWNIARSLVSAGVGGGEPLTVTIRGRDFFSFVKSQLSEDTSVRRRAVSRPITLFFYTAGEALYNFIRVNQAQSGITSLQTLPDYTNVEGGLGIFSTRRYKALTDLGLTRSTLDSLSCGVITRSLHFVHANCF